MTTIPIEVIVQDAEASVVPGEDGTNTNTNTEAAASVAVPNTGEGNGGIFSGSASAIVSPAILLVLALGSIVAILIYKYHKQKKDKTTRKEKLAVAASSTIAVFAATVLISNLVIPATKAATSDTTDGITPAEDKISIVVTRDGGAAEESIESTATITSTSDFGYTVLLSMAEGVETSNLYLDGDETSEHYIASTESTELADNTWGYTLEEDGEYAAVPLVDNAATVSQGDEAVEDEEMGVYYGVKVSSDLPAGTYSGGEIEYSLVVLEPTIGTLTYMQDFAKLSAEGRANVLASMTDGGQYTLKDSRDQKEYFVSKLADGNVWMTQNLAHDIGDIAGGTYTPVDTDVPANWTPTGDELTKHDNGWGGSTNYVPRSYDPGDLYWNGALIYDEETCIEYGGTWSSNYGGSCSGYNTMSSTGNDHYRLGNYYNWTAAVAMSDSSSYTVDDTDVNQSICPAGWMLPKGGTVLTGSGSFAYLKNAANLTSGADGNIHVSPNYFTYSGSLSGNIGAVGGGARYLSSVVKDTVASYGLDFDSYAHFNLPATLDRGGGYSVRCVVR